MTRTKHRVLVVGSGSIGERHTRCFLKTERVVVAICESQAETRDRVAIAYELEEAFSNIDDALQQNWDAVLIATPADTHVPIALRAVVTGAALLIEKPLATTLSGIPQLQDEVNRRGAIAAVSYNYRAHPGLQAMKDYLDDGSLGRPLQVISTVGQDFAYFRPAYRDTYFSDHATGGGAIHDALSHHINLAEWLVGPITQIFADAAHQKLEGVSVEDTVSAMARHGDVMATYSLNLYQLPNEVGITVICENGALRFELQNSCLRRMIDHDQGWIDEPYPLADRDDWYVSNANAFLDAVEGKREPLCSLDEGIQTLCTILAAHESLRDKEWSEVKHGS